jgi:hypothetical protein
MSDGRAIVGAHGECGRAASQRQVLQSAKGSVWARMPAPRVWRCARTAALGISARSPKVTGPSRTRSRRRSRTESPSSLAHAPLVTRSTAGTQPAPRSSRHRGDRRAVVRGHTGFLCIRHDDRLRHPWSAPRRWASVAVRRTSAPPLIDGRYASTRPAPLPDRCRSRRRGRSHPSPASHQLSASRSPARSRQLSGSSRSIRRTPRRCGSRWFPRRAHRVRGDPALDPSQRPPRVLVVEDATLGHDPSRARPPIWRFTPRRRPARCGRCSASSRRPLHVIRKPLP